MDPLTALAAVSAAVNLVKKAVKTVDDVRSLGPVLGKYFDAKADAVKVLEDVNKGGFKGSNMGKAVELELAIHSAREFEEEVKGLFFPNNMDVWEKIVARRHQMDKDDKASKRRAADAAIQARKKRRENLELWTAIILSVIVVVAIVWGGLEILIYCKEFKCGS
jgi:t-SNARE complex subunit (syntaxin)